MAIMRLQQDPRETETEEDSKERACPGVDQGNEGMPRELGPKSMLSGMAGKTSKKEADKEGVTRRTRPLWVTGTNTSSARETQF